MDDCDDSHVDNYPNPTGQYSVEVPIRSTEQASDDDYEEIDLDDVHEQEWLSPAKSKQSASQSNSSQSDKVKNDSKVTTAQDAFQVYLNHKEKLEQMNPSKPSSLIELPWKVVKTKTEGDSITGGILPVRSQSRNVEVRDSEVVINVKRFRKQRVGN
ncbi:hypothetical protein GEMRC1_009323 [Eukaryota sp. GEM-RC1]